MDNVSRLILSLILAIVSGHALAGAGFRLETEFIAGSGGQPTATNPVARTVAFDCHGPTGGFMLRYLISRGLWEPYLQLKFPDRSTEIISGPRVPFKEGARVRLMFEYRGDHTIGWQVNGRKVECLVQKTDTISPEAQPTPTTNFNGTINFVRVTPLPTRKVAILPEGPLFFRRGAANAKLRFRVENLTDETLEGLPPRGEKILEFPYETQRKPRREPFEVSFAGETRTFEVGIGPCSAPRMVMRMDDSNEDVREAAEMGFNLGKFGDGSGFSAKGRPSKYEEILPKLTCGFDEATAVGITMCLGPKKPILPTNEVGAVWRDWGRMLAPYAGFDTLLPYSEVRDRSQPTNRLSVADALKRFPGGVVPDDDEYLVRYRAFWSGGDGWPAYFTAASEGFVEGMREGGRTDAHTLWDPGVRCPPRWGSGGAVEYLSQWVYPNPEPMAVAGPAEEILAMVDGRPGQQPAISGQLMAYTAYLIPKGTDPATGPEWLRRFPKTNFIAIPTDAFRESFWAMFAKPMKHLGFYSWHSIKDNGNLAGYVFSNPELRAAVRETLNGPFAALGPMMLKLGREKPDVAVLESFTSVMFDDSWTFARGWHSAPVTFLQRARLDPRVVYEETLARDGFDGIKVLYIPYCRFLTKSMIEKVAAFRKSGGLVIGDPKLLKAVTADFTVPVQSFARPPEHDFPEFVAAQKSENGVVAVNRVKTKFAKDSMLADAAKLRAALAGRYAAHSDSSDGDIVIYNRRWREIDYLVAVNDRRTFGDYVGQWGLMMEKGLPHRGWVSMRDEANRVKAVYELSRGGRVDFVREGKTVRVPVDFQTTDGRVFAFLPETIAAVRATAERLDDRICVSMRVCDASGAPVHALLPVEVRVFDANGAELDGAGFLVAEDGEARVSVLTNLDDASGDYLVVCTDRASGCRATCRVPAR